MFTKLAIFESIKSTGFCEKVPAKFGEESSVKAGWLCIGCLGQLAEVRRENSQEFVCSTLYSASYL